MRKLNGITINGEYLGNSVVINGMFRAICTISPVIMRDFVLIINKIDTLEDAVKIHNFNCGFDCIDIEFENKTSKGMASLYFKLHDGEPLLKDCKLVIDDVTYSTFEEKIKLRPKNEKDMTNPSKPTKGGETSELDRLQKIRELREKKQAMQKQQAADNTASLTPEQQKEQKRKELLEKKRKLLEAKKAKMGENGESDTTSDNLSNNKRNKPSGLIAQEDGSFTNEQGQPVVKEERINPDGTISEVYVNPENPDEVYEKNENGEFVSNNISQDDDYSQLGGSSLLDSLSDEDLANMSDEELAALEAELNAELDDVSDYNDSSQNLGNSQAPNFDMGGFAQELAHGLTEGLTQGISQGLAQGLAQGFSMAGQGGGFGGMGGDGNNFAGNNAGFAQNNGFGGNSFGNNFGSGNQDFEQAPTQPVMPDYSQIDNINSNASLYAKDTYAYDENSNPDDISDFYADFYNDVQQSNSEQTNSTISYQVAEGVGVGGPSNSEFDALKAELEALKAQAAPQKDLMTLDEFLARQKEIEEAKEKLSRQRLKIVGSKGRVNANALDGGVFVAGKKVYKWGDPKVLDE